MILEKETKKLSRQKVKLRSRTRIGYSKQHTTGKGNTQRRRQKRNRKMGGNREISTDVMKLIYREVFPKFEYNRSDIFLIFKYYDYKKKELNYVGKY